MARRKRNTAGKRVLMACGLYRGSRDLDEDSKPARTFLVHGEEHAMSRFAALLEGTRVTTPALGESIPL